ncbi:EpsI family protein [bacterium]|jgi:hypothetical protein|nr:EpsI family protein [bacterium]
MEKLGKKQIILIVILSLFAVAIMILYLRKTLPPTEGKIMDFPLKVKDWQGAKEDVDQMVVDILETDKVLLTVFTSQQNKKVWFSIVYGEDNRLSFHPPENCYLGSGQTELLSKDEITLDLNGRKLEVNKRIFNTKNTKQLVLYWYMAGDREMASYYKQQFYLVLDQIKYRKSKGALIRVSSVIVNDNEEETYKILYDFLIDILPVLRDYY